MTTCDLNGNWIDTLRRQYVYDLKEDHHHPIEYLLWISQKNKDLYYVTPNAIDEQQLRRSFVKYHKATKGNSVIKWENEYVQVTLHPRYRQEADHSEHQPVSIAFGDDEPPAPDIEQHRT